MSRDQSMLGLLHAAAKIQWNVALILEAKAVEAEKVRAWICGHMRPDSDGAGPEVLKEWSGVGDQVVETIEGITKVATGLNGTLKALMQSGEDAEGGLGSMLGGGFDLGDS